MISLTFLRKLTTKVVESTTFDVGVEPASFMSVVNAAFFSDPMLDFMPQVLATCVQLGSIGRFRCVESGSFSGTNLAQASKEKSGNCGKSEN